MKNFNFGNLAALIIGFDHINSQLHAATREDSFPPYDIIELGPDSYQLRIAVAGFDRDEIEVNVNNEVLTVSGKKPKSDEGRKYLRKGLAERDFNRRIQLAPHVEVTRAALTNGVLDIELIKKVPDALKPRRVDID